MSATATSGRAASVVFAARAVLRLFYHSFFKRREIPRHQRTSVLFCVVFFAIFPLVELFNAACLLLDEVLFPRWRHARIRQPIFIIGAARSGTTILHRVMAEDEQRFFCFRTWEIAFPAIVQKKAVSLLGALDRRAGGRLRALFLRAEARRFRDLEHIHEVGFFLPEEDDKLFVHILASADLAWLFPYGDFARMARLDVAVDAPDQRAIMGFYVRCVRRQAYVAGGRRTFLSKNPMFSGKVANLLREFPDCKIIYLVRNPLEVVPSSISLGRALVRTTRGVEADPALDEDIYEAIKFYYTYPLDQLSALPEDRFLVVKYEDLMRQPGRVIERIYGRFGFTLTAEFAERLEQGAAKMREHRSRHEYSLDRSSVTRERVLADLHPIFDRFAFTGPAPANSSRSPGAGMRDS